MNGGGGGGGTKISLRLQYYVLLAGVGAVLLVACLKYMPAAAAVAAGAGYGSWGSGLAVATRAGEPEGRKRSPVVIFNFGDSNSDTGGMAAASGLNIALPEGRTYFRRPTGRLSDGRLVIDFICESLNTPHLSPYLKALGSDFSNGANFAIGGSTATPGGSPFSLDVQLHQFLYFRTRSFELLNKESRAIARHVLRKHKPELLGAAGSLEESAMVDVWVDVDAHQLEPVLQPIVWNCIINPFVGRDVDQGLVDESVNKLKKVLEVYEARLSSSKYLAGDFVSFADLTHFSFMRYFMATEHAIVLDAYPRVKAWWEALLARSSVKKVMAGMPPDFGFGSGRIP